MHSRLEISKSNGKRTNFPSIRSKKSIFCEIQKITFFPFDLIRLFLHSIVFENHYEEQDMAQPIGSNYEALILMNLNVIFFNNQFE